MITASHLTKRYRDTIAVDDVSFTVTPGRVTGFLGSNGAGKSTTMRMILGLDTPTSGSVTIDGVDYRRLRNPLRTVGALLDPNAVDPKRTARDHLRWLALSNGIDRRRVDAVLGLVGLGDVGNRRVGGFSLGMQQRLGLATALIGDPETVLLDEPINGLDPEGILWLRHLVRSMADEGRTVFISSHLMAEMAQTADDLIVIGRGQLIVAAPTADIVNRHARSWIRVRAVERQHELAARLRSCGVEVATADGALLAYGLESGAVGAMAAAAGIVLAELNPQQASLEEAFLELTHQSTMHRCGLVSTNERTQP
jgi:ABC-2 type transport system ATP-binding protein